MCCCVVVCCCAQPPDTQTQTMRGRAATPQQNNTTTTPENLKISPTLIRTHQNWPKSESDNTLNTKIGHNRPLRISHSRSRPRLAKVGLSKVGLAKSAMTEIKGDNETVVDWVHGHQDEDEDWHCGVQNSCGNGRSRNPLTTANHRLGHPYLSQTQ